MLSRRWYLLIGLVAVTALSITPAQAQIGSQCDNLCDCSTSCATSCYYIIDHGLCEIDNPAPCGLEQVWTTCGAWGTCTTSASCPHCKALSCTTVVDLDNTNNTFNGTAARECIYGRGGNDTLDGNAGDDRIFAGPGTDTVYGDSGNDCMYGADGNDHLDGESGDDYGDGQGGTDTCSAATEDQVSCP